MKSLHDERGEGGHASAATPRQRVCLFGRMVTALVGTIAFAAVRVRDVGLARQLMIGAAMFFALLGLLSLFTIGAGFVVAAIIFSSTSSSPRHPPREPPPLEVISSVIAGNKGTPAGRRCPPVRSLGAQTEGLTGLRCPGVRRSGQRLRRLRGPLVLQGQATRVGRG